MRSQTTRARRILICGLASPCGGRLAQQLERDDRVEAIIGVDTEEPRHALSRTEFVRVGADGELLRRIIGAAAIDTVVQPRPRLDALAALLSASGAGGTPVRTLVVMSSAEVYGTERDDPAFFTEEMERSRPPRQGAEESLVAAERLVGGFARRHPGTTVTVLRAAAAIGGEARGPHVALLGLPVIPGILGFDPRLQFIHEDDAIGALRHATLHDLPGVYNAAADGVLALSEVASLLGKPLVPALPPWGTVFAAVGLRRLGLAVPVELVAELRHGRGLDNRRLKAAGYHFRHTSREAVMELRAQQRLRPLLGSGSESYRYEREVEAFLRWSPAVHRRDGAQDGSPADALGPDAVSGRPADRLGRPDRSPAYADLTADELLELIPSLEPAAIALLRDHEAAGSRRAEVLAALEHQLELRGSYGTR